MTTGVSANKQGQFAGRFIVQVPSEKCHQLPFLES
jgi:hypothetical protein